LGVKHNPIPFSLRLKFTLLSIIFPTMLWAQPDWQLRKDENGIKVFTKDVAGYYAKRWAKPSPSSMHRSQAAFPCLKMCPT
jgi:hypothetical protein